MKHTVALLMALPLVARGASPEAPVTFNKQIAPIIYQNCSSCHRPGEAAPFTLLSYSDVAKKARTIARVTAKRIMPPWKAEPASYPYRDERRLTDDQIALIQKWVDAGTPEGNAADKIDPPKFASGWQLGEPDLIIEMPTAFHIPADGPDIYRNIPVPLGLTEDKWITAIDMKPTARAAVHHVIYFGDPTGRIHENPPEGDQPGFGGMGPGASIQLGGMAVGAQPHFFPEGLALPVPKNTDLVVQYHFHPDGKPEQEKSLIGLYFAKEPPTRKLTRIQMPPDYSLFSDLNIPAGDKDFVIRDTYTLPVAVDAVGVTAHAHSLGREMKMTATFPNGDVKTLLLINDWDFSWQDKYYFKDFVTLPAGTRLDSEIHWDNSTNNVKNPHEPPVEVSWGEQTTDEMGSISLIVVAHDESELPALFEDVRRRERTLAREKMQSDPALAAKVRALFQK